MDKQNHNNYIFPFHMYAYLIMKNLEDLPRLLNQLNTTLEKYIFDCFIKIMSKI